MLQSIPGGFQKFVSKGKRKKNGEHVPNHWSGLPIEVLTTSKRCSQELEAISRLCTTVNVNCQRQLSHSNDRRVGS